MASRDYYEFLDVARDTFGLDYDEARQFWRDFEDALGFRPDVDALVEYGDLATDIIYPAEAVGPEERDAFDEWERTGDRRDFWTWYDAEWLDAYYEVEISEYIEYEG